MPGERPLEATADLLREMGPAAASLAADIGWAAVRVGDPVVQVLLVEALIAMGPEAAPARHDLLRIRDTFTGQRGLVANEGR